MLFFLIAITHPIVSSALSVRSSYTEYAISDRFSTTMSFGTSVSDAFLLLKGVTTVATLLNGKAVEDFKRHMTVFCQVETEIHKVHDFVEQDPDQRGPHFDSILQAMNASLRDFLDKLDLLHPYLGPQRDQNRFLRAVAKLSWPSHAADLADLRQDLEFQIQRLGLNFQIYLKCVAKCSLLSNLRMS